MDAEHGFAVGHLFAWIANKGGEAHNTCEAVASLRGVDAGEAPHEQQT